MSNIRLFIIPLLFASFFSTNSYAQFGGEMTLDKLVNQNTIAMGGKENIEQIDQAIVKLDFNRGAMTGTQQLWIANDDKYKMEVKTGGNTYSSLIKGDKGWSTDAQNITTEMPGQNAQYLKAQIIQQFSSIKSPLYGYDPANSSGEYLGKENRSGVPYHKVEIAPKEMPNQKAEIYLAENSYFVKYVVSNTPQGVIELEFKDYKKFDNVNVPTQLISKLNGQVQNTLTITELDLSPKFTETMFKEPIVTPPVKN